MIEIKGKYNSAFCFTPELEEIAENQIQAVCDQAEFSDCKIRIMPDVHAGKGCTIGTTMTISDKIVPGMVGVDIGCGMETVKLAESEIDFSELDKVIRNTVPCGFNIRKKTHTLSREIDLTQLRCIDEVNLAWANHSIGTLGGGNHFIEVDRNSAGELYLVVHSGSRHIGCEVAEYYQDEGYRALNGNAKYQIQEKIEQLKAEARFSEIEPSIAEIKANHGVGIAKELAYVQGKLFEDYIHDMRIIQRFAELNRKAMVETIITNMGLHSVEEFTTIHNYIDTDEMILRKGAVSAKYGEKLLVPINMRDGSLICIGKGNDEWNQSAPHGAGRIMSRKAAFTKLDMKEYREEMNGVFSTCVTRETLDESPMAYKSMDEILEQIVPTAKMVDHIRPVYNFKAS